MNQLKNIIHVISVIMLLFMLSPMNLFVIKLIILMSPVAAHTTRLAPL